MRHKKWKGWDPAKCNLSISIPLFIYLDGKDTDGNEEIVSILQTCFKNKDQNVVFTSEKILCFQRILKMIITSSSLSFDKTRASTIIWKYSTRRMSFSSYLRIVPFINSHIIVFGALQVALHLELISFSN